jgi:peptidoglycan/xylan/chitin deacetylase (PgdA/CDA1 family)
VSPAFEPLVLCYHAVSATWPHGLSVAPEELERQVCLLLARGYRPVDAEQTLAGRGKLLHVTFDDAYRSIANGLPLLERLGVPATVFVCSGYAEDGRPLDIPELAAHARERPAELATMDWGAVRELIERGVEVGSHTVTHPHLPQLSDADLARELGESRERLEDELRRPCPLLAYPYGQEDLRVRAAARAAGYKAAFAMPSHRGAPDPFALPRVAIWRKDTLVRVRVKTSPLVRRLARWL